MPPSLLITSTSPGRATSIASTGLAQSPAKVWTVTAGPAIRSPGESATTPIIAPVRCIASVTFGAETVAKRSRISSSADRRLARRPLRTDASAAFTRRVAAAGSADRTIAPPTITMAAPCERGLRGGFGVEPARDRERDGDRLRELLDQRDRGPADHLLVDPDVAVQDVHAELGEPPGPRNRVRDADQVGHDPDAVEPGGPDRLLDHGVVGVGEDADDRRAGLRGHLDLERARVRDLHVRDDLAVGEAFGERPDRGHPLALDQRCSRLEPVGAARDRLLRDGERAGEFEQVERDLEDRRTHIGRDAHPAPMKISHSRPRIDRELRAGSRRMTTDRLVLLPYRSLRPFGIESVGGTENGVIGTRAMSPGAATDAAGLRPEMSPCPLRGSAQ